MPPDGVSDRFRRLCFTPPCVIYNHAGGTLLKGRKPEDFCAMHVCGDSMYPDFRDGDIVLVLKQNTRNHSGEIGVISYGDDEMTIKRINYVQSED